MCLRDYMSPRTTVGSQADWKNSQTQMADCEERGKGREEEKAKRDSENRRSDGCRCHGPRCPDTPLR